MIKYIDNLDGINESMLQGFFVGWPNPPNCEKHYQLLKNSTYIWLAIDDESNRVVGFINANSDKVLSAYIPLLEVLPTYQGKGIGGELVKRMIETLKTYYMVDLMCDDELQKYYSKFDMFKSKGMILRNYDYQSGR